MKNFARLVRFALPYKVRFGLSIACAAMVALLFFAELVAVYPLLHILFNSQNPQKWVAEKIESYRDEIDALEARSGEIRFVVEVAPKGEAAREPINARYDDVFNQFKRTEERLHELERKAGDAE